MKKLIGCIAITIFIVVMISAQSTTSPVGGQGYGTWGSPIYAIWSDSSGWSIFADSARIAVTSITSNKADSLAKRGGYVPGDSFLVCYGDTFSWLIGDSVFIEGIYGLDRAVPGAAWRIMNNAAGDTTEFYSADHIWINGLSLTVTGNVTADTFIGVAVKADSLYNAGAYRYGNNFFRCDVPDTIVFGSGDSIFTFWNSGLNTIDMLKILPAPESDTFRYGVMVYDSSVVSPLPCDRAAFYGRLKQGDGDFATGMYLDLDVGDGNGIIGVNVQADAGESDVFGVNINATCKGNNTNVYGVISTSTVTTTHGYAFGAKFTATGQAVNNDTTFGVWGLGTGGSINVGGKFTPQIWVYDATDTTEITGTTVTTDTLYGVLGGAGNCVDVYIDTIYGCAGIWFLDNAWFPSGDTLWFVDATGTDTLYITQFDGHSHIRSDTLLILEAKKGNIYLKEDGNNRMFIGGNIASFSVDLAGSQDADNIIWDGKWCNMDYDADDSLCGYIFGFTDSIVWDSIPEDLYITCGLWLPETLFFTDGRGGADTSYIVQQGGELELGGDNNIRSKKQHRFDVNIEGSSDAGTILWDGKWIHMDYDGDDSLCGISFNAADSLKYDSISQNFMFTDDVWIPDTLFFTDGQGGADTSFHIQTGSIYHIKSDNAIWLDGSPTYVNLALHLASSGSHLIADNNACQIQWDGFIWFLDYDSDDSLGIICFDALEGDTLRSDTINHILTWTGTGGFLGMDIPAGADTFRIYDDGDTTYFDSDNPIKIGGASLVIASNGVTINDSLFIPQGASLPATGSPGLFFADSANDSLIAFIGGTRTVIYPAAIGGGDVTVTDIYFNAGGGLTFGELGVYNNVGELPIGFVSTKVQYDSFNTDGLSNNTTPDETNEQLTIDHAGIYQVTVSIHASSVAGAGALFAFDIYKNNGTVQLTNLHAHRNFEGGGNDIGSISISGLVSLSANDDLELWVTNETNAQNIVLNDVTLSVVQVGK
jgi:hypothetical protein